MAALSIFWIFCLFLPLLYLILKIIKVWLEYEKHCDLIKRLPGVPPRNRITGHVLEIPRTAGEEMLNVFLERLKEYPRMTYAFLGPLPTVALFHPETAKEILKTAEPKPTNLGAIYNFIFPWLGEGLLVAGGKRWARNRKLLTAAFHFDILKPYVTVNNRCVDVLIDKWIDLNGGHFEVFNDISLLTFDVILKCAFSYDIDCQQQGESHPYVKAVSELGAALPDRILNPFLYPSFLFKLSSMGRQFRKNCNFVHKVADGIIQARRNTLQQKHGGKSDGGYLDFLDILLTAKDSTGKGLNDKEIRQEVDTFMFEGHDTTASGISWALYSLANSPECMKKCQDEVDRVLQDRDSDDILWNDLSELKYLSMCIKESLRHHTTVPFIQRITTKDCYVDGFFIPKNTNISLPLYTILHHPEVWHNPMEFIPERFSPQRADKMDSHAFLPFSAGPRNCIGQHFAMHEMKVIIARLIRRCDFELKVGHEVKHVIKTVMKAENGVYMKAKPRNVAT